MAGISWSALCSPLVHCLGAGSLWYTLWHLQQPSPMSRDRLSNLLESRPQPRKPLRRLSSYCPLLHCSKAHLDPQTRSLFHHCITPQLPPAQTFHKRSVSVAVQKLPVQFPELRSRPGAVHNVGWGPAVWTHLPVGFNESSHVPFLQLLHLFRAALIRTSTAIPILWLCARNQLLNLDNTGGSFCSYQHNFICSNKRVCSLSLFNSSFEQSISK